MRTYNFYCYRKDRRYQELYNELAIELFSESTDDYNEIFQWCMDTLGKEGTNWKVHTSNKITKVHKFLSGSIFCRKCTELLTVKYIQFCNKESYILYKLTFLL